VRRQPAAPEIRMHRIEEDTHAFLIAATGFMDHSTNRAPAPACKQGGVPCAHAYRGRALPCARAMATAVGLDEQRASRAQTLPTIAGTSRRVLTGDAGVNWAVGTFDFLQKPAEAELLVATVARAHVSVEPRSGTPSASVEERTEIGADPRPERGHPRDARYGRSDSREATRPC
jgi:hypothetical protein